MNHWSIGEKLGWSLAMAKLPWFKWNADAWLSDEKLRSCSLAARGLWADMLSLMHKNDRRGHLEVSGKPVSVQQLARMVGCLPDEVSRSLAELRSAGVFSVREDGVIYSRRMTDDEHLREVRSKAGAAGAAVTNKRGPPVLPQQNSGKKVGKEVSKPLISSLSHLHSRNGEGGVEGEENRAEAPTGNFELTPDGLAQRWCFLCRSASGSHRDVYKVTDEFREWIKAGIPASAMRAEIERKGRDRSEPLWELKKRLQASMGPGNGKGEGLREMLERKRKEREL